MGSEKKLAYLRSNIRQKVGFILAQLFLLECIKDESDFFLGKLQKCRHRGNPVEGWILFKAEKIAFQPCN